MDLYGLIGKTLKHSFSEAYFREKFEKEQIDARFQNFELETIDVFPKILSENPNLLGLSVTIPYKTVIIPFLDEVDPSAKEIGSVNSIRVSNGKTIGFNTDAGGFSNSIKPFLAHGMERALILGTGGASKAVAYALRQTGLDVVLASRTPEEGQLGYSEINQNAINAFKLIVNTTPLGMYPDVSSFPDIPYEYLTSEHLLYDLTYNPAETEFLRRGKEKGAIVVNGLSMLKIQAEMSWEIWTG
ncbi:shikimate dehydrogenase [Cryomorpha ignava]|uniref:Shikimate dehydrogenase n=1 Tax=Cryomorpha ignava TaxID=101383 RepID=A0A7K3WNQ9_9FLAO|nr:shikimate dehydrogenase [Cryomorpha ignava]NEN23124.1 shikimate dehydrogenase [Cryomorpha ignava]